MRNFILAILSLSLFGCSKPETPAPVYNLNGSSWVYKFDSLQTITFSYDSIHFNIPTVTPFSIKYVKLTNDTILFPSSGIKHIIKISRLDTMMYIDPVHSDTMLFSRFD